MDRVFLDWSEPALPAAAYYLLRHPAAVPTGNLGGFVIVLPGARAGRRLLEILVEISEDRECALVPPRIVTAGRLLEVLGQPDRPVAGGPTCQWAWCEVLRRGNPEWLEPLIKTPPEPEDILGWLSLAELFLRLHTELSGARWSFADVARRGADLPGFGERARWLACASFQELYLETLDSLGLADPSALRGLENLRLDVPTRVVLIGTVELNATQRWLIDRIQDRVTAVVHAPETHAERFDNVGALRPMAWQDVPIALADDQISVADRPRDQAQAALRALEHARRQIPTGDVTIGVADETLVPFLRATLKRAGRETHFAGGLPLDRSPPYRLLNAIVDFLARKEFSAFAALVRHPDVEGYLNCTRAPQGSPEEFWLAQQDRYYDTHLPATVTEEWLGAEDRTRELRRNEGRIREWLAPLEAPPKPLEAWIPAIRHTLENLYQGRTVERGRREDWQLLESAQSLRQGLVALADVPASITPSLSGVDALRVFERALVATRLPEPPRADQTEILGWLELALDDAPGLVITGFNEEFVPASRPDHPFLPDPLRTHLGLPNDAARYARDAYALCVMLASRAEVQVVVGRRSAERDPLTPSRLLFATDALTAARRIARVLDPTAPPAEPGEAEGPVSGERSRFPVPGPEPLTAPLDSLRITAFRDYLACPYRFYLRHVLGLKPLHDREEELTAAAFGALAHDVLQAFGASEAAHAGNAEAIAEALNRFLDAQVADRFGAGPLPTVRIQVEQLRQRLHALAHWQAAWRSEGWRIEHVELIVDHSRGAHLDVDGEPFGLRGRIDRIDVNTRTGEQIIFDYKTSERARSPEQLHQRGGEWRDLQLPLYRHLARACGLESDARLGFIVLPRDVTKVGDRIATWTPEDLERADAAAHQVVRDLRAGRFWPPDPHPPPFSEVYSWICQDHAPLAAGRR